MQVWLQGLAETTKVGYRHHLELWRDWWPGALEDADPADVHQFHLDDHPDWKRSTRHNSACAIRRYYLSTYGDHHPMRELSVSRKDPGPQRTLSKAEARRLVAFLADYDHLEGESYAKRVRDRAWIMLALGTGLRRAELARLTVRDLDLDDLSLKVECKGGHTEKAVFTAEVCSALREWLELRRRIATRGAREVFVSVKTKEGMHPQAFWTITRRLAKQLNMPHFSPHALRRRFAVSLFENGATVREIMLLGRWKDPEMVLRYARVYELESARDKLPRLGWEPESDESKGPESLKFPNSARAAGVFMVGSQQLDLAE